MKEAGYPGVEIGTVDQFQVRTAEYFYSPPQKKKKFEMGGGGGGESKNYAHSVGMVLLHM